MVTVFLQKPTDQVAKIDQSLELASPETAAYRASMQEVIQALVSAKLECMMNLRPTSDHSQFTRLEVFITRVRDLSYRIITELGDPAQDFEPIIKASELLNTLASHIVLRQHVQLLVEQPVSIGEDVNALNVSMKAIMVHLENFLTEVQITFGRL
jgi:hypothetical protein